MTKTPEELKEQLYDERFDRLEEKLDDIKDMLGNKASSGSVFRLEEKVRTLESSHIPCASVVLVQKEVSEMKSSVVFRSEFEQLKRDFDPIKEATDGAVYFARHPSQLKALIAGAIVLVMLSVLPSWLMWRAYSLNVKKAQTEQPKPEAKSNIPK